MIARPHVCWQCRLRLAHRVPSNPSPIRAAFNSTFTSRPNLRTGQPGETRNNNAKRSSRRPQHLHQTELFRDPLQGQERLGKPHGLHAKKLREARERLDINALGQPADVIVLKNSKFRTYNLIEEIAATEESNSIDILAALDDERGIPGQQEINGNIDQFRPKEGQGPQDWDAFNALMKDIQAGFTTSQLARYIQSFRKGDEGGVSILRDPFLIPHISPWIPESAQAGQRSEDDYTRGYSLASYTNKQKLVLRLLRECWKVAVPELEYGIGEVELELKPKDYDLLLRGSKSVLSLIAAEYIAGDNERIDGFRSRHTIRITTNRLKSEMIINDIETAVRNIRRENIALDDLLQPGYKLDQAFTWLGEQFNSSIVNYLGRMTNAKIDTLPKNRWLISCVDQKPDSAAGNKIDTVLRLLVTSATFSNRVTTWLRCRETAKSLPGTFVAYPTIEGLGWRDRLRLWTRWTAPTAQKADDARESGGLNLASMVTKSKFISSSAESEKPQTLGPDKEVPTTVDLDQPSVSGVAPTFQPKIGWEDSYQIESSALIGSVLHSHADAAANVETVVLQPRVKSAKVNRTFSTVVPNLSKIIGSRPMRGVQDRPHRTLIMHFQPNPFFKAAKTNKSLGGAALSAFPPVEMRFSIDPDTNTFKVRSVIAVTSIENSDLMLPESPSDVRFQQRSVSTLIPTQPDGEYPPGIARFLSDATLDIQQGSFDAPAKLAIPIAPHLYKRQGSEQLGDVDQYGLRHVEYLFTGLEVRKTVMLSYDGWRLHYTSIEAGRAGGRRGELRLLPVRLDESAEPATEANFLQAACKLAEGVESLNAASAENFTSKAQGGLVTKLWVDPEQGNLGLAGRTEKSPKYFSTPVEIRQTVPMSGDNEEHEHSAQETEDGPVSTNMIGKEEDNYQFA